MAFKNFRIWRGRLPHWRADDVTYYVTFRHRRPLTEAERSMLLSSLLKPDGKKWAVTIACVMPETSELLFTVHIDRQGTSYELAEIVERAKSRAGKQIVKKSGERFVPFYAESFDRIVRDQSEYEDRWTSIFESAVRAELVEDPEDWHALYVVEAPT